MRTIITLPDEQALRLTSICKEQHISRAMLIRNALEYYIEHHSLETHPHEAFGILRKKKLDSIAHQRKLRDEWE